MNILTFFLFFFRDFSVAPSRSSWCIRPVRQGHSVESIRSHVISVNIVATRNVSTPECPKTVSMVKQVFHSF